MEIDPGKGLHYLDNASTTFPKPEAVLQAMVAFCAHAGVSPGRSTYDLALVAESMVDGCFDVACRTGLHCAPLVHETLGTAPDGAVRFSVGALTTRADVEAGAAAVAALAAEARLSRA